MKKLVFLFFVFQILVGCKSQQPTKITISKTNKKTKREINRSIKILPKDIVVYRPDTIFKDTTIIVKGRVNKLRLNYQNYQLKQAECESPGGKVTNENIKENIQENVSEKTEYVDKKTFFMYGMFFSFFLMIILLLKK